MKSLPLIIALAGLTPSWLRSQNPQTQPELKPGEIVHLWFERWNALDGSEEATQRLLDLYLPDAFHQIGPSEKQMGLVRFVGHAAIRKMIDDFTRTHTEISFRIETVAANEKHAQIIHVGEGPWGGPSVAVQYSAAYTTRQDKRRWMYPGAGFFQIQNGKIRGVRLYMARDELMEVFSR